MKLLYGTGNPAKLSVMKKRLKELGIELIGLHDLKGEISSVPEDGQTPLENAGKKALAYYSGLARQYGDLTAAYKNAICLVLDEEHIYEAMEPSMESERFLITEKPHINRKQGFPLDSLSIDIESGKYYYDLPDEALDEVAVEDGFLEFFRNLLLIPFLLRAKKATYAGKGAETSSTRPQSHDLIYREDDYMYYDTYLGGEKFAGEEALWIHEKPYWSMNYVGRVVGEPFSGDFLKEALFHVPEESPFRGPEHYSKGDYTYRCQVNGDFTWFQGYETISFQGQCIYECYFHGGIIK